MFRLVDSNAFEWNTWNEYSDVPMSLRLNLFNATFCFCSFFSDLGFIELIKINGCKHFIAHEEPPVNQIYGNSFIIEKDLFYRHKSRRNQLDRSICNQI